MLRVKNIKVYDLKESIIACRNAMRLEIPEYTDEEFEKSLERMKKLVQASKNGEVKCHDNALTGIRVSFDLVYPQYISPELQRYHFFDIVTSSSKMHRLLKMDIDKACNMYVSRSQINTLKDDIDRYNRINNAEWEKCEGAQFVLRDGRYITAKTKEEALYHAFMRCISDCPMGLELFMRCSTNYKQLQTIYTQRKHHKLKNDWGAFCDFIRNLPYAKDLILNEQDNNKYKMKYFTIKELCHSDVANSRQINNTPNENVIENLTKLVANVLDPLREWYGKPIHISSGYRCKALNDAVGGVSNSFHLKGYAVDIDMGDKEDNKPIFDYIKNNLPFTEMGWEGNGRWVHVAYREDRLDREIFHA